MTRDRIFEPHPDRLAPEHPRRGAIVDAHRLAVEAGEPGYIDPTTGFWVFTSVALIERGECCDSGCRHCPFVG